ncbi:MAG: phosphoglycerate kinase [Clostridia bacterium]|nr:phosphoglycerate kinase [Clostridia bacterium]
MNKKSILDVEVKGKRCLVRVDFNVPMKDGVITDENRINGALPTIKYLIDNGAKVILCSHMGKPKGQVNMKYTLRPVAERLSEILGQPVTFATDVVGESADEAVANVKDGEVVLLENTRFEAGEEKRDEEFCKKLASYCDIFVNDAFGTAHRSHGSTAAIVEYGYVKTAVCGFLIEKELSVMAASLESPVRPFVAILGGAKVADKLNVINNLLEKCDTLIIGGGMAYTFLKAQGYEVGTSLVDDTKIEYCLDMMKKAKDLGKNLLLPVDAVITKNFPDPIDAPIEISYVDIDKIPQDMQSLDIGPKTRTLYAEAVKTAKTVIWNGPMGVFENPTLAEGTKAVAMAMADTDATTIIGGGDSAAAVAQLGFANKMSHISTGGGASLELFEGKVLPGIACLNDKD